MSHGVILFLLLAALACPESSKAEKDPVAPVIRGFSPKIWVNGDFVYRRVRGEPDLHVTEVLEKVPLSYFEKAYFTETKEKIEHQLEIVRMSETRIAVLKGKTLTDNDEATLKKLEDKLAFAKGRLRDYKDRQLDEHHYFDAMKGATENANKSTFKLNRSDREQNARDFMEKHAEDAFNHLAFWSNFFGDRYKIVLLGTAVSSSSLEAECKVRRLGKPLFTDFVYKFPVYREPENRAMELAAMSMAMFDQASGERTSKDLSSMVLSIYPQFDFWPYIYRVIFGRLDAAVRGIPESAFPVPVVPAFRITHDRRNFNFATFQMEGPIDVTNYALEVKARRFRVTEANERVSLFCWSSGWWSAISGQRKSPFYRHEFPSGYYWNDRYAESD